RRYVAPRISVLWDELKETLVDGQPTPEQRAISSQRAAELQSAMNSLTARQRDCLHLRAEGLRYREIAEILGISLWSVVDALERAVGKMRKTVVE
ncbi:MAG: RNA polymerase sigma factor, partial [Bryobacteraceae bacterium]